MNFGVRIPEVALEIQEKVKVAVENMTGLKVKDVNVHRSGGQFSPNGELWRKS